MATPADRRTLARLGGGVLAISAMFALPLASSPSTAHAQTEVAEDEAAFTYLTVETDQAPLKCASWELSYPVAFLDAGTVLRADQQEGDVWRVLYPRDVPVLVEAPDVRVLPDRNAARLLNASRLLARNASPTDDTSWKSALLRPLPAGSELTLLDTLEGPNGQPLSYLVEAPPGARAYIADALVRPASDAEINDLRRSLGLPVEEPARAEDQVARAEEADAPAEGEESEQTQVARADENANDAETMAEGTGEAPVDQVAASNQRTESEPDEDADAGQTAGRQTDGPAADMEFGATERQQAAREVSIDDLESAFERVIDEPVETAEITPLLGEFEAALTDLPDTERNQTTRAYLRNRIELLRIKQQVQRDLQRLSALEEEASEAELAVQRRIEGLDRTHAYVAVGRLVTSTLYDGRRLPLLYRLVAVTPGAERTILYVAPTEQVDLEGALGSVIGVEGVERSDTNLRLTVIRPTRIDVLRANAGG
jgi:hypothetical protein